MNPSGILQCINLIVQISTNPSDHIAVLNISAGNITTSYPYNMKNLQRIDTRMNLIGVCNDNLVSLRADDLFPIKIPKIWKKSYIRTTYIRSDIFSKCIYCKTRYKGIESEIFIIISKYLGMPLKYIPYSSIKDPALFPKKADVIFGFITIAFWSNIFDVTSPYLQERITSFVPFPLQIPRWKYIFTIFDKNVCIAALITVLAISAVWTFNNYMKFGKFSIIEFAEIGLSPFKLFLGQSRRFYSKNVCHKVLVFCIIFLSTMMNFFFGTRLSYLLNGKNYDSQIETTIQLKENNFYIGYNSNIVKSWSEQTLEMRNYPQNFYIKCSQTWFSCIRRSVKQRNIVLVGSERLIRSSEKKLYSEPRLESLNLFHLQMAHISAYFSNGYPLSPLINRMLQSLVESGIVKTITEKYDKLLRSYDEPLNSKSLAFEHMVLPLFIWTLGMFLGLVIFYYEIVKSRYIGLE
ncbi:hypothetical protein HHI36_007091 [Cryptolaemus montrouzieri]|uniref:Ionotropic receptor n=1 Tax=Cryptolaemus montrouzieri TaxID=559131 RepID=A0ABD2MNI1_9CUCU